MKFEVGEVCEVLPLDRSAWIEGEVLAITLRPEESIDRMGIYDGGPVYRVRCGRETGEFITRQLRKKRPPEEDNYIPESIRDIFKQKQPQGAPA